MCSSDLETVEKLLVLLHTLLGTTFQLIPVSYTHLDVYKRQVLTIGIIVIVSALIVHESGLVILVEAV